MVLHPEVSRRKWRGGYYGPRSTSLSDAGDSKAPTGTTESSTMSITTTASIPVSRTTESSVSSRPPATESSVTQAKEDPLHSKTSIARLSYHLKDLPKLFVVEVEINAIVDRVLASNSLETIWNRTLREEALNELLDHPKYDDIRKFMAFDTRGSGNANYIIVSLHDVDESTVKNLFVPDPQQLTKTTRRVKTENGYDDQRVLCEVLEGRTCTDKRLPKLYWPNLLVMIRKRATGTVPNSKYGIDHDFFGELQGSGMDKIDVSVKNMAMAWDLILRNTPTIDARKKLLHFNYDLDVVIPARKRVHDLLSDVLGSKPINGNAAEHMSIIERLLIGLQVRCAYLPPDRTAMINGERGQVFLDKLDQRCRQFRIADVRMPSAIPNFAVDGMPSDFSVQSFFNNLILPKEKKLAKQTSSDECLLLVSDGYDHWVPIDMIYVDDPAATSRFTWLHARMKNKITTLLKQDTPVEEKIKPMGAAFFHTIEKKHDETKPFLVPSRVDFLSVDPFTLAVL